MTASFFFAAMFAAVQAAGGASTFPCEKLGDEGYRVIEAIGADTEARAAASVQLRKKALLARAVLPLARTWRTLDDPTLATEGGKMPAISFASYRIGGVLTQCTSMRREGLFGANDRDGSFLLRCLIDGDGDGRFEAFRAHGELVSYDSRTGKSGVPTGVAPQPHALPKPVALVESTGANDPNATFAPRIVSDLRVMALTDTEVTLGASTQVAMLPGSFGERFRGSQDERRIAVPLAAGDHPLPDGRTLRLSRKGRGWTAAVTGNADKMASLQCGGSVVAIGDRYTIMSDGGLSVIDAKNLPGS